MSRTQCAAGVKASQLSAYMDGELPPAERRAVEAHLASCVHCSELLADLAAVVERAAAMEREAEPSTDLWPGIRARLKPRPSAWSRVRRPLRDLLPGYGFRLKPSFAVVAGVTLLVAAAFLLVRSRPISPPEVLVVTAPGTVTTNAGDANPEYYDRLAVLRSRAHAQLTHDPRVMEVLEQNLQVLDMAIAQYADALAEQPGDERLRSRIEAARQRKMELLQETVSLTAEAND
jgi:hypothetical protein